MITIIVQNQKEFIDVEMFLFKLKFDKFIQIELRISSTDEV